MQHDACRRCPEDSTVVHSGWRLGTSSQVRPACLSARGCTMPIEILELAHDGTLTTTTDPGDVPASPAEVPQAGTGTTAETAPGSTPGVQGESAPPPKRHLPPMTRAWQHRRQRGRTPTSPMTLPLSLTSTVASNSSTPSAVTSRSNSADERNQNALRQAQFEARARHT